MVLGLSVASAQAGDLVYTPVNPNFGGSSFNGAPLLESANAQNGFKTRQSRASTQIDPLKDFTRTLTARLLSNLSSDISDAIFGKDAKNSGTFVVGTTTISFYREGTNVNLTISDSATGSSTNILLPVTNF
ncbi:MAG: curli assembly protein CsgF [Alphaproteobacteria bacterium]